MDIDATHVKASFEEPDKLKISFFLGRKSKYKDKILNIYLPTKDADKFLEEIMREIWENKVNK